MIESNKTHWMNRIDIISIFINKYDIKHKINLTVVNKLLNKKNT